MKVNIERKQFHDEGGWFKKAKTDYFVILGVVFTEEEKAIIKERGLEREYVVITGETEHGPRGMTVHDLLRGDGEYTFMGGYHFAPSAASQSEFIEKLKAGLQGLKDGIAGDTSESFEL